MPNKEKFINNQDGTITDSTTELMWMQEDAWQKEAKWFTWDEAIELANYFNGIKLGGFQDWRLPTEDEIQTYLSTGGWKGKAGAYNVSERIDAGWPIHCEGDLTSVMGLPMKRLLAEIGGKLS